MADLAPTPTPAALGFAMPPEWEPHAATLMAWPCRRELWGDRLDEVKRDYAAVARAVAAFEPVLMACRSGTAAEVRDRCGGTAATIETLEIPLDDSWARDSGPIFVRDRRGEVVAVRFRFNAWGDRWHPYADDALLPSRVAAHLGMRCFEAPLVLEGGAIAVDGEGSLLTTEQCLLNPNRNPGVPREDIERVLRDFLGAERVIWLPFGHHLDDGPEGTDGHVDGVAGFVAPGTVYLEAVADASDPGHATGAANLERLRASRDARGRTLRVRVLDPGADPDLSYANHCVVNGGVIVPVSGRDGRPATEADERALAFMVALYPGRQVVPVPGEVLHFGGGGPHCITQQIPAGPPAAIQESQS